MGGARVNYAERAIERIRNSQEHLSLNKLVTELGLEGNQDASLRRALRTAAEQGKVVMVGLAADGSRAWIAAPTQGSKLEREAICAAHGADLLLTRRLGVRALDIERAAKGILASIREGIV